ncbi:MAG: hypothetical protein WBC78_16165 [Candidatus Sulfotelmatobacter sp.]
MTRINLFRATPVRNTSVLNTPNRRTPAILNSIAWGKINLGTTASPLVFAAILIVCSVAVGCSREKPKNESANNQSPIVQSTPPAAVSTTSAPATPTIPPAAKPVHRKVVRRPTTVTYADKTTGVTFQYPRKYLLKTGDAADELISSDPVPMDFVQPGGGAVVAVAIPEGVYPKSDLASAFFDVSVNKSLTAEQCGEFSEAKVTEEIVSEEKTNPATPIETTDQSAKPSPKLMIGDMELHSMETLATDGTRKEAAKYFHTFENGSCYEFALKVATTSVETDEGGKAVDRDEVFKRLAKILATVKIDPVKNTEATTSVPAAAPSTNASVTPAQ